MKKLTDKYFDAYTSMLDVDVEKVEQKNCKKILKHPLTFIQELDVLLQFRFGYA